MKPHIRNYPHCLDCGKKLKEYRSKRCYKCNGKLRSKTKSITKKCPNCNRNFTRPLHVAKVQKFCKVKCGLDYYVRFHKRKRHHYWKEEGLTYSGMHGFILKTYGKAPFCLIDDETCSTNYEWANISHKDKTFKFDKSEVSDYIPLCESHHCKFDKKLKQ